MATDSEWDRIRERAAAEDVPISRYVVQQILRPVGEPPPPSLPIEVQWLMARNLLMLAQVEKHRFERAGERQAWDTLEEACEAFLDAEALQG